MSKDTPEETITIRGKKYAKPSIDRLNRAQARKAERFMETAMETQSITALWDLIEVMLPDLPEALLDELSVGECKQILSDADLLTFTGEDAEGMRETADLGE